MKRVLSIVLALGSFGAFAVASSPASADCSGPTIWYTPGTVNRGDVVSVRGTGWGNACYDTGPPPQGQGVLGAPIEGITISFQQGARKVRVARGGADDAYRFEVSLRVPIKLKPGPATITASWSGGDAYVVPAAPFVVTGDRPSPSKQRRPIVRFGAATTTTAT